MSGGLFCRRHWTAIPEDLRARIRWALDSDDEMDLLAALEAVWYETETPTE